MRRNPYIDPLHITQVELMRRLREQADGEGALVRARLNGVYCRYCRRLAEYWLERKGAMTNRNNNFSQMSPPPFFGEPI